LTATVLRDMGLELMAIAGQSVVLCSIGLALLAPALVRVSIAVLAGPVQAITGLSGYLSVLNLRQRTNQMAGALVPIVLFTGIATGTLYLQGIENAMLAQSGTLKSAIAKNIEMGNLVVVSMIALFAAIMLVNTLIAATAHRRQEFGQQRLAGATPAQVLGMVSVESVVLTATGILFGSLAAIPAITTYSHARTDSVVPETTVGIYLAVVAIAVVLAMASSIGAARKAISTPAIQTLAA
jgi:putative ABC transport system permease protein